jgi:hypothetical protein
VVVLVYIDFYVVDFMVVLFLLKGIELDPADLIFI